MEVFVRMLISEDGVALFIGDSQMDGIINAIHCDLERTYNATAYRAVDGPTEQDILSRIVGSRNLGIFDGDATALIMQKVELLLSQYKLVLLVLNTGVHFNLHGDTKHLHMNSAANLSTYLEKILPAVNYLSETTALPKRFHVAWLETMPQHFDSSNGYFLKPSKCVPLRDQMGYGDWRNRAVREIINQWNLTHIHVLNVWELLKPLHREHFKGDFIDCTHYCWTPMLWQPLFKQVVEWLSAAVNSMSD